MSCLGYLLRELPIHLLCDLLCSTSHIKMSAIFFELLLLNLNFIISLQYSGKFTTRQFNHFYRETTQNDGNVFSSTHTDFFRQGFTQNCTTVLSAVNRSDRFSHEQLLTCHLLHDYLRYVRPVKIPTDTIMVNFSLAINQIFNLVHNSLGYTTILLIVLIFRMTMNRF